MSAGDWTESKVARLKDMRAKGHSFGAIGKAIGMSRNACISKASRLGLPKHDTPARPIVLPSKQAVANAERAGRDERDLRILKMMANGHGSARAAAACGVSTAYADELWQEMARQDPGGEAV